MSRFLAAHEACGSGFQITRTGEAGRPRLRLLCQGCGQRAAYAAGDAGLLGEEPEVVEDDGEGRRFAPAEGGVPAETAHGPQPTVVPVSRSAIEGWLPAPPALPWWIPNAYILLVIAIGIALIAFGVVRQQENEGDNGPSFGSQETPQTAPAPTQAPDGGQPTRVPQPAAPPAAKPEPPRRPTADARTKKQLDRVTVLGRFGIGVPDGWSRGMSGGAFVFRPGDDEAEIRIFLQQGADRLNRLERDAARFMRQEHVNAKLSPPVSLRLGSDKARELRASFRGGTETAVVVSADGYSYLLLGRVDSRAPASLEAKITASLRSFRAQ